MYKDDSIIDSRTNYLEQFYAKDIAKYPKMSKEEEKKWFSILQDPNQSECEKQKAKEAIMLAHLQLAIHASKIVYHKIQNGYNYRTCFMDLVAEANLGLVKAMAGFDYRKSRFATYAFVAVQRHLYRYVNKNRFIYIPHNHYRYFNKILALVEKYGDQLTPKIIHDELGIGYKLIADLTLSRLHDMSNVNFEDLSNSLSDPKKSPYSVAQDNDFHCYLFEKLSTLSEKEQRVLKLYFFEDKSDNQIAQVMGYSKQGIMYIKKLALNKLGKKISRDKKKVGVL